MTIYTYPDKIMQVCRLKLQCVQTAFLMVRLDCEQCKLQLLLIQINFKNDPT